MTIYANATIVGGETIRSSPAQPPPPGFLTQSVPPNSLVTYENMDVRVTNKADERPTDFQI